jgi:hypothetical protein
MDNAEAQSLVQRPENSAILKTMIAEHPDMPKYFFKHALMFYLMDCIKFEGNKKKRGRKPKPPPLQTEIKGAVTVK